MSNQHDQTIEGDAADAHTRGEGAAYIVIGNQFGAEFSSESLDTACHYVADKLRAQAMQTELINPSSYRIQCVKAG